MDQQQVDQFMAKMTGIEATIQAFSEKADAEIKSIGKVSKDTETALETLGIKQRELADEIQQLKQRQVLPPEVSGGADGWGAQLTKSEEYTGRLHLIKSNRQFGSVGFEVKNTLTGSDTNVAPARDARRIVPGAFAPLTLEAFLQSVPTSSNAVEFTRENVFTNSAAEASEGADRAQSSLTWTLVNMPISSVAHFIKISRQLAADNAALAAYVDTRMRYGVNRKVETQLVSGDGTAPNISGILDSGNYTAHGYANADLGSVLKKLVLIRKIIGDLQAAGDDPDGILLNPADWAAIDIDLFTIAAGQALRTVNDAGNPMLFGKPVITSVGVTADNVVVGNFGMACTIHNREGVVVEMSDSDSDNFTKGLITLRAERRLALAVERPAAIRAGDLTPA